MTAGARRLGLERRRHWNDATITAALGEVSADQTPFPNAGQFRAAGLSGLYSALERRGELNAWAHGSACHATNLATRFAGTMR